MTNVSTIDWPGLSGSKYQYWIYSLGTTFNQQPGNYVFAKEVSAGNWSPVYIGQTESLGIRLANHEKESCAKRNGATHIHVHASKGGDAMRREEESDLIAKWNPPCNAT